MQVCKFICVNKALQTCGLVGCSCNTVALANLGTQVGDKVTIKLPNAHTNVTKCVLACFSTPPKKELLEQLLQARVSD